MEYCGEIFEELDDDAKSTRTLDESRKQNHSEIEKRRRDKMNTYINELSSMIPMCYALHRKLDKLTVLRMAVQHLRGIRGTVSSYSDGDYKPTFLSDKELKMLILQAAEGFLFVVGCDRGRILYVSESVSKVLNCTHSDLLGQSWFDVLHPKDVAKVKEQLSSLDASPRERFVDPKTMLPLNADVLPNQCICPGARRSFFCRMKLKPPSSQIKEESDTSSSSRSSIERKSKLRLGHSKYRVIQCTGYLKSWASTRDQDDQELGTADDPMTNMSCLVAIGRIPQNAMVASAATPTSTAVMTPPPLGDNVNQPPSTVRSTFFISRHSVDGKFLFIDQRATLVIGFLPQEILGTSFYEYFYHEDIPSLAESHKMVLQLPDVVTTQLYRFRCKDNSYIRFQSEWRSFRNPWTTDIEYITAKNTIIR